MTDTPNNRNELIIAAAVQLLRETDPKPFTPAALERLHTYVAAFVDDLVLESIAVMRRHGDKMVLPSFVEIASNNLRSRRKQLQHSIVKIVAAGILGACASRELRALFDQVTLATREHVILAGAIGVCCAVLMWLEYR